MEKIDNYIYPSEEVLQALKDLELYFQLCNQDVMKSYFEKGNKDSFRGTLSELFAVKELENYFSGSSDDTVYLKRAIFLIKNYSTEIDSRIFTLVRGGELNKIIDMIQKGSKAYQLVSDWIKPLREGKNVLQAIEDATEIDIDRFQILELAKLEDNYISKKIGLFPHILQIVYPTELIQYLRLKKDIKDCLIVTLVYNKERDWKSVFYMFLIYNGILYSIDNSEQRLNEDNTEGDRSPDRYLERKYEKIWLPIHLALGSGGNPGNKALLISESRVYKIASFEDYIKGSPEYIYWLQIFMNRVKGFLDKKKHIPKGITYNELPKLLASGNTKEVLSKLDFGWRTGAGSYLDDIYGSKVKSLALRQSDFSMMVGTKKYVEQLVAYKTRQEQAEQIQKLVEEDFNKNYREVYKNIREIVCNYDKAKLVKRAMQDKEYTYMYYAQFGTDRGCFAEGGIKGPCELRKDTILYVGNWIGSDKFLNIRLTNYIEGNRYYKCLLCKNKGKQNFVLKFIDYRQFLEFFELEEGNIPKEMVDHLHQQSELYTGNSILDDTDPVDNIFDPWFRCEEVRHEKFGWRGGVQDLPYIRVGFCLCYKCIRKICREFGLDYSRFKKEK